MFDVNENLEEAGLLADELEADIADLGYIEQHVKAVITLLKNENATAALNHLVELRKWVNNRQSTYVAALGRLRVPED